MAHPRQAGERSLLAEHQIAQRAPGEVGRRDAVAHIAARDAKSGGRIHAHGGGPIPRDSKHAAPGVLDGHRCRRREHLIQQAHQLLDRPALRATERVGPRAETVGHAAAAQRDASVGRSLGVHVGVRRVAQ